MSTPGSEFVEWLEKSDLLQPGEGLPPGPEQGPEEDGLWDWWEVDWDRLLRGGEDDFEGWLDGQTVESVLNERLPEGWQNEPSHGFDVCAWYSPMHFSGSGWGITVRNDCVVRLALEIRHLLAPSSHYSRLLAHQLVQAAFDLLFQHELFHHKVEALSIRLEITSGQARYTRYSSGVYRSVFGTDDCLEEALANAFALRWMKNSQTARKTLTVAVRDAATRHQQIRLPHDPPGYNQALHYVANDTFKAGESTLATQVNEGIARPQQPPSDFALATHMTNPLYTKRSNIWVVVDKGRPPALPTGAHPLTTCSSKQMERILEAHGFTRVKGGKGSHIKLDRPGARPVTLPGGRKNLSPGVTREALKAIDRRIRDLPQLLKS